MESDANLSRRLDSEFDQHLADMKPFVLKLTHKSERQRCAMWIKKFCEPPGPGITGRKNRNMYTQLLLTMLTKGLLEGPFTQRPEPGQLPTLPTWMSIYFDDGFGKPENRKNDFPSWIDDLGASTLSKSGFRSATPVGYPTAESTLRPLAGQDRFNTHTGTPRRRTVTTAEYERALSPSQYKSHFHDSVPRVRFDSKKLLHTSSDEDNTVDVSLIPRSRSPVLLRRSSLSPRRGEGDTEWRRSPGRVGSYKAAGQSVVHLHERELDVKTNLLETKFHEEKLRIQQKHDEAVQKILDRKNAEIEDVKTHYRTKNKDLEDAVSKLEKKVSTLVRESSVVRENKDKQIAELKKMAEASNQSRVNESEKNLHDAMADFEQDKFDMQKQHTKSIQELLDDTNARLQKMEHEYSQQIASNSGIVKDLEIRINQLTREAEYTSNSKTVLERSNIELEGKIDRLLSEVQDFKSKYSVLDQEHRRTLEQHDYDLRGYRQKVESDAEYIEQENHVAATKAADTIADLEDHVDQLKHQLQESESNRQRHIRELEQNQQQDKVHSGHLHEKEVRNLRNEIDQNEQDYKTQKRKLEEKISSKDVEISNITEQSKHQMTLAEKAFDDFKIQVEKNSAKMFDDMKKQMGKVEVDLARSKQLREKQNREFEKQREDARQRHQHEVAQLKVSTEQMKAQLLRDHHLLKEAAQSEHEQELDNVKENLRKEIQESENQKKDRQKNDSEIISELEQQIRDLREEVVQSNQLRKQQLIEIGLLREEERQNMLREHESHVAKVTSQLEQQKLYIQKTHGAETEKILEKTNARLKEIEREYTQRSHKMNEVIEDLQKTIELLKEEKNRIIEEYEKKVTTSLQKQDEEKRSLRKHNSTAILNLQQELDTCKAKVRSAERRLQQQEAEFEGKFNELQYENEQRLRGLMPAALRDELENTISSLKSQVHVLQQRAMILQEELDVKSRLNTSFGARSLSPTK